METENGYRLPAWFAEDDWAATEFYVNGPRFWCAVFHGKYLEESSLQEKIRCNKCKVIRYNIKNEN